jgi:membrane-associated phospholipid phosphatase
VKLGHAAIRIGQFVAMHHKMQHGRARPSRLLPALMPPIDPPGHAAYPSGHATEAYLLALLLAQAMPGVAWGQGVGGAQVTVSPAEATHATLANDITRPVRDLPGMANRMTNTPLWRIAERIARNREVLGMHYPSDSEAGLRLAAQALPILLACPLIGAAGTGAIDRARAEWA